MTALVTGVAGFIGSQVAEALCARGETVVGVDSFSDYYLSAQKEANLESLLAQPTFSLHRVDLSTADVDELLAGVDVVYHQAGQPGVRLSWDEGFETYDRCNVLATQRLLEAVRRASVERLVYASSSSVYGNAARYPVTEDDLPAPHSPYGVTKLAGEHLCGLYAANHGVSTVALRYFTVYGPRQRPDMAIHRLIEAALRGSTFPLFGDGTQVRDFTFVGDVVRANLLAAEADVKPGSVMNVCGGGATTMTELIDMVGEAAGTPIRIDRQASQPGDVRRTGGSSTRAQELLGWNPQTALREGIEAQVRWHEARSDDLRSLDAPLT